jgi:putative tricarboxylic transport membrane protein
VKSTFVIEGILMGMIGIAALIEGLRLIFHKDPMVVYDILGPGFYILIISIALIITALLHVILNQKKIPSLEKVTGSKPLGRKVISTVAVCAIYIYLIDVVGYVVATVIFFLLEFKITGVKSWWVNFLLTVVLTGANYLVFVKFCDVVFPRGIFF